MKAQTIKQRFLAKQEKPRSWHCWALIFYLTNYKKRATITIQTIDEPLSNESKEKPRSCRSVAFSLLFTLIAYLATT